MPRGFASFPVGPFGVAVGEVGLGALVVLRGDCHAVEGFTDGCHERLEWAVSVVHVAEDVGAQVVRDREVGGADSRTMDLIWVGAEGVERGEAAFGWRGSVRMWWVGRRAGRSRR